MGIRSGWASLVGLCREAQQRSAAAASRAGRHGGQLTAITAVIAIVSVAGTWVIALTLPS